VTYPLTAIISDLHGNAPALETAIEDARRRKVERFVCLGDIVGYGASPRHNLDFVMRACVAEPAEVEGFGPLAPGLCLLGNHEYALLHGAEDFNPKARAAIDWTREDLSRGDERERSWAYWDFLAERKPSENDELAMFAHGSPRDPVREYLLPRDITDEAKMRANWAAMTAPVCFVGHSHVPAVYFEGRLLHQPQGMEEPLDLAAVGAGRAIVNVGSVGQPRDGDNRLSYVVFDGARVTFVRLAYDIARAADAIRRVQELPDYLADRLAVGR
jgi:diadenosine tetraphosphatase ApaH/serine/threonine PP2A family protein phosphatase